MQLLCEQEDLSCYQHVLWYVDTIPFVYITRYTALFRGHIWLVILAIEVRVPYIYISGPNLVSTPPAYIQALNGVRPSSAQTPNGNLHTGHNWFSNTFCGLCDIKAWQVIVIFHDTYSVNTLRQSKMAAVWGRYFQTHTLEWNVLCTRPDFISVVPIGPFKNAPELVQIMACFLIGDKPLSVQLMALFTDIYGSLHELIYADHPIGPPIGYTTGSRQCDRYRGIMK